MPNHKREYILGLFLLTLTAVGGSLYTAQLNKGPNPTLSLFTQIDPNPVEPGATVVATHTLVNTALIPPDSLRLEAFVPADFIVDQTSLPSFCQLQGRKISCSDLGLNQPFSITFITPDTGGCDRLHKYNSFAYATTGNAVTANSWTTRSIGVGCDNTGGGNINNGGNPLHPAAGDGGTDLSVLTSTDVGTVSSDGVITYTVLVRNTGTGSAPDVVLKNEFPAYATLEEILDDRCKQHVSKAGIVCRLGDMGAGAETGIAYSVRIGQVFLCSDPNRVPEQPVYLYQTSHATSDHADRNEDDNGLRVRTEVDCGRQTFAGDSGFIKITKKRETVEGNPNVLKFTVTGTNYGYGPASTVVAEYLPEAVLDVTDIEGPNCTFQEAVSNSFNNVSWQSHDNIQCIISDIPPLGSFVLSYVLTMPADLPCNEDALTIEGTSGVRMSAKAGCLEDIEPIFRNVAITTHAEGDVLPDGKVLYKITVYNQGNMTEEQIPVRHSLPPAYTTDPLLVTSGIQIPGLRVSEIKSPYCRLDTAVNGFIQTRCTIPQLKPGESHLIEIVAEPSPEFLESRNYTSVPVGFFCTMTSPDLAEVAQGDLSRAYDAYTDDNTNAKFIQCKNTIPPGYAVADIQIVSKEAGLAVPGKPIEYKVRVRNNGQEARSLVVRDTFDEHTDVARERFGQTPAPYVTVAICPSAADPTAQVGSYRCFTLQPGETVEIPYTDTDADQQPILIKESAPCNAPLVGRAWVYAAGLPGETNVIDLNHLDNYMLSRNIVRCHVLFDERTLEDGETIDPSKSPVLELTEIAPAAEWSTGGIGKYSVNIRNNGEATLANPRFRFIFPTKHLQLIRESENNVFWKCNQLPVSSVDYINEGIECSTTQEITPGGMIPLSFDVFVSPDLPCNYTMPITIGSVPHLVPDQPAGEIEKSVIATQIRVSCPEGSTRPNASSPDLQVQRRVEGFPEPGNTVKHVVSVTNIAPLKNPPAQAVVLRETMPEETTPQNIGDPRCVYDATNRMIVCELGEMNSGERIDVTYETPIRVGSSCNHPFAVLKSVSTVTGSASEKEMRNNQANSRTPITCVNRVFEDQYADFEVTIDTEESVGGAGKAMHYVVMARNNGPDGTRQTSVNIYPPSYGHEILDFEAPPAWDCDIKNGSILTQSDGTQRHNPPYIYCGSFGLNKGETRFIRFAFAPPDRACKPGEWAFGMGASVTAGASASDPNPYNNHMTTVRYSYCGAGGASTAEFGPEVAGSLRITKEAGASFTQGARIPYTLTVENIGTEVARNIAAIHGIDAPFSSLGSLSPECASVAAGAGDHTGFDHHVRCLIEELSPGETRTFTYDLGFNFSSLPAPGPCPWPQFGVGGALRAYERDNTENFTRTVANREYVACIPGATRATSQYRIGEVDARVEFVADKTTMNPSDEVGYTLTVTNDGNIDQGASTVLITAPLQYMDIALLAQHPSCTTDVIQTDGYWSLACNIPQLEPGASTVIPLSLGMTATYGNQALCGYRFSAVARIGAGGDGNLGNNEAFSTLQVNCL